MGFNKLFVILGVLLLGSGLVMAYPVNATVNGVYHYGTWVPLATAGNFTTEGGNISEVNVTASAQLTDRWAGIFGVITGTEIVLKSSDDAGGTHLYNWTASTAAGGEICVSTGSGFDFSAIQETIEGDIEVGDWVFGDVADNVSNTFEDPGCGLVFTAVTPANTDNTTYINHVGSDFITCAFKDTATPTAPANLAFCTEINASGTNYKGNAVDYELMVPTNDSVGAIETYYFFVEIN